MSELIIKENLKQKAPYPFTDKGAQTAQPF